MPVFSKLCVPSSWFAGLRGEWRRGGETARDGGGRRGGGKGQGRIVTKRARRKFTSGSGPGTRCAEDGFHAWALSRGANFFVRGLDAVCTTRAVCTMRAVLAPRPASQACGTTIAAGDARGGSVPLPRGSQSARAADGGRATTRSFLPSSASDADNFESSRRGAFADMHECETVWSARAS